MVFLQTSPVVDPTIYKLLLWAFPALVGVLAFIGAIAVRALIGLNNSVNEIKVNLAATSLKHDSLEKAQEKLEERIDKLETRIYA